MSKEPLTQRQNRAYDFIESYLDQHQKPPTLQEIGDALDISSTNGVYKLLRKLEKKGWIEREKLVHPIRGRDVQGITDLLQGWGFLVLIEVALNEVVGPVLALSEGLLAHNWRIETEEKGTD